MTYENKNNGNFPILKKNIYLFFRLRYSCRLQNSTHWYYAHTLAQSSKAFSNSFFGIASSNFHLSCKTNERTLKFFFFIIFWIRKKSHGYMSGKYGGCSIITVLYLDKNSRKNTLKQNENRQAHKNTSNFSGCLE